MGDNSRSGVMGGRGGEDKNLVLMMYVSAIFVITAKNSPLNDSGGVLPCVSMSQWSIASSAARSGVAVIIAWLARYVESLLLLGEIWLRLGGCIYCTFAL
jgi:hypothetical protein